MVRADDFEFSTVREPHRGRAQAILAERPEVRDLVGKNPYSFAVIVGVVALQFFLAWMLSSASWWIILLTAYLVGAFADHALFVMIHKCAHNLIFRGRLGNLLSGITANLPMTLPSSVSFGRYHLRHHAFQGVYDSMPTCPAAGKPAWSAVLPGARPPGWRCFRFCSSPGQCG